jgi:hypothetical protein
MAKRGLWIALFVILSSFSLAAIDINQDQLDFGEIIMENQARKDLVITSDSSDLVKIKVELSDNLEDIVRISPQQNLYVSKDAPLSLQILATPVSENKVEGKIYLLFEKVVKGSLTSFGDSFLTLGVSVSGTQQDQGSFYLKDISLSDTEEGLPLDLKISFDNQKNSQTNLQVNVIAEKGEKNFDLKIPALYSGEEHIKIPSEMAGESLEVELTGEGIEKKIILTPNLLPCLKKIELIDVYSEASEGDAHLTTLAQNKGECPIDAEIVQQIFLEEEMIKETRSKHFFPVGEPLRKTEKITAQQGEYLVRTTVYYADTFTNTQQTRFKVTEEGEKIPLAASIWVILIGATILALIIFKRKKWRSRR